MAIYAKVPTYDKQVEDGVYTAKITSIELLENVETQYGLKDKIKFVFTLMDEKDGEGKPIELQRRDNNVISDRSKLGKLIKGVLGKEPDDPKSFDIESLLGMKCQVVVQNTETENGWWSNVETVLTIKGQTSTKSTKPKADGKATMAQLKDIMEIAKLIDWDIEDIKAHISEHYEVTSSKELTDEQADETIIFMQDIMAKMDNIEF